MNTDMHESSGSSSFEVIPAVDVKDGQVVQLVGGERGTGKQYGDPVEAANRWIRQGAETLHLVDLDGAFEGHRENATAIEAIIETTREEITVQLGGGIRTAEDAVGLVKTGVDRVILGTAAVESPEIVSEISQTKPESVIVSLDAANGEVVVSGWTEKTGLDPAVAASRYEQLGASGILFTDVDVEGQLDGVNADAVRRVADAVSIPVIASGGVASIDDIRMLREAGAAAVVVGTALYEGTFSLTDAERALDHTSR